MTNYSNNEDKIIETHDFVILYSPLMTYNITYYVPVWSGYNPLLSLECYNHNKHVQL